VNEGLDGTLEWIESSEYTYTYSKDNVGVCYSLNSLADLAQTNYILYLNDDMFVAKDWDHFLYEEICLRKDEYFYFSGTMVEYENTGNKSVLSPFDFGRDVEHFDEEAFNRFVSENYKNDWYGACWPPSIVQKKLWDLAGGYDVNYSPGFYSDPDFAMKLWTLGVRDFRGIGRSLVYHFKCKSTGRVLRNNGRKTFAEKWGIPSSFFYSKVLKMGEEVNLNTTLTYPSGLTLLLAKIKAWYIAKF
jgi:GT2 family glycosyltransferase